MNISSCKVLSSLEIPGCVKEDGLQLYSLLYVGGLMVVKNVGEHLRCTVAP